MEELYKLTLEQRLVIFTSRITITDEIKEEIKKIVNDKTLNWFEFIKYCLYHKVLTLAWYNIHEIVPEKLWPKYLNDIVKYAYNITIERNTIYLQEMDYLIKLVKEKNF